VTDGIEPADPAPDAPAPERQRVREEGARVRARVATTWAAIVAARPRIPALDAAFDVGERDREVAGGLLAGAIAFRLFLWLVPFAVVVVTLLGVIFEDLDLSQEELARRFGIAGVVARYVSDAGTQTTSTIVVVLVVALYALLIASRSSVRALRLAHVLAWRMPIVRFRGTVVAGLWFAAGVTALVLVAAAMNTVRASRHGPGVLLLLLFMLAVGAVWLFASWKLPHPSEVPIRALVPGAILVAVGVEILHVVTVLYYAGRIEHSSELYGGLGAAVGLLAWLYLVGRLAIGSAVLNASLWRRRHPDAADAAPGSAPG
jgi:membrane protein